MTKQPPDDGRETDSFKIAEVKILSLLRRLDDKHVCPCCTARALALHAAGLAECEMGSAEAIELFENIIGALRENDIPPPARSPSTEMH
jgi:hypothetical protein